MTKAMSGLGPWKPNAMRVRRRILALVDSINPLDSPESIMASMAARWSTTLRDSSTKAGIRQRRAQDSHRLRASLPSSPLRFTA